MFLGLVIQDFNIIKLTIERAQVLEGYCEKENCFRGIVDWEEKRHVLLSHPLFNLVIL